MKHEWGIAFDRAFELEVAPALPPRAPFAAERFARHIDAAFIAEWQQLAAHAAEPNSFQEPWFAAAGLEHLTGDQDIRLVEVRNERLIGVIPLCVRNDYGRIPAANVRNWRHHNDFLGTPLVRQGHEAEFWRTLLLHLDGSTWAAGFLHINGLVENGPVHAGLLEAASALGRPAPITNRRIRAALSTTLSPAEYLEATVRKKKRKELKRLANRLAELGTVTSRTLQSAVDTTSWCDHFLELERRGWKGDAGSALASHPPTEAFFRKALAGAAAAGRLQMRRLDLDGKAIAMLINFLAPPGSFSFKIAYDEDYARFSPGVLLQLDNLDILERGDIAWMDSCAAENHPMIDSLWAERRTVVRLSVPLAGARRRLAFACWRAIEAGWAEGRRLFGRLM
ncbi:MAG TPA: GNAT family N-acetyltransferase [Allosphingosinicella sp.]|jgi:CelD/BcsL family acetyltransferase involved in cellulose biosynthesis